MKRLIILSCLMAFYCVGSAQQSKSYLVDYVERHFINQSTGEEETEKIPVDCVVTFMQGKIIICDNVFTINSQKENDDSGSNVLFTSLIGNKDYGGRTLYVFGNRNSGRYEAIGVKNMFNKETEIYVFKK